MSTSKNVFNVTDSTFESDVIKSTVPTLVDFWAEWCGPCRALTPTLEQIADEFQGKVKVCKMNVDENSSVPSRFQVLSIPTLLLFKQGQVVEQLVGLQPKATFVTVLQKHIK